MSRIATRRAQASLFDGIAFLTVSMLSVSFVFVALGAYGNTQSALIDKSHITAYIQNAFKSIYFIDASTLSKVNCSDDGNYCTSDSVLDMGCGKLGEWSGITVAELVKRDLRDFDPAKLSTGLDDMYGPADAPGKQAARCAFKEIFKPFTTGGYSYFVEFKRVQGSATDIVPQVGMKITSFQQDRKSVV